jgi:hypothetical protein
MKRNWFAGLVAVVGLVVVCGMTVACGGGSSGTADAQRKITSPEDFSYAITSIYAIDPKDPSRLKKTGEDGIIIIEYNGRDTAVVIPDTIEGLPVVNIGSRAFKGKSIESVVFPNTVFMIDSFAFEKCKKLRSVKLPSGLLRNGSYSFMDCSSLTSVTFTAIQQSMNLGDGMFTGCTKLTDVIIPDSVTEINSGLANTFKGCSNLTQESRQKLRAFGYKGEF